MICQNCHKNVATVTVIEILPGSTKAGGKKARSYQQQHLCEICAQAKKLPHAPLESAVLGPIWKLLQQSGPKGPTATAAEPCCPDCGMTREEFRRKGRLGCPKDYQVFAADVMEILERVHGATSHQGRIPQADRSRLDLFAEIAELRRKQRTAIHDEDYESAARIRDRLKELGADAQA